MSIVAGIVAVLLMQAPPTPESSRRAPVVVSAEQLVAPDEAIRRGVAFDALLVGVEVDGVARAYPIASLAVAEVVNDEVAGVAIAASW